VTTPAVSIGSLSSGVSNGVVAIGAEYVIEREVQAMVDTAEAEGVAF
jgi:hypothetical protein